MTDIDFSQHHFLVVDDKRFLRNLIQGVLLQRHAGSVRHASHGAGAINMLSSALGEIDCILCDWNMEPVNGLELLRMIRTERIDYAPRDIRFIMMTGYGDERVVKAAMALDVSGYLVKPVSSEHLIKVISAVFTKPQPLKAPDVYEKAAAVDLPDDVLGDGRRIPPWVLLSAMRQTDRQTVTESLDQIRAESANSEHSRVVKNPRTLALDEISAGQVLAENIYNEIGRLLLARGTVLNDSMLHRLNDVMLASHESIRLLVGDFGE